MEGLCKNLGRRKIVPTPIITHFKDASVVSNAKQEKIYLFENEMILTAEDQENGKTEFVVINTETWEMNTESYEVPGYIKEDEKQLFNSFIYENKLYQVLFNSTGLHLNTTSFETGNLIAQQNWATQAEFEKAFPFRISRKFTSKKIKEKMNPINWERMYLSLGVVISPEAQGDRLIIGSHLYMDQGSQDAINTIGALSTVAGFGTGALGVGTISVGNFAGVNVFFDPFSSINYLVDAAYYFGAGRVIQVDGWFNPETLEVSTQEIQPNQWEEIMAYVHSYNARYNLHGVSLFERGDKIYFGSWRKKVYTFVSF